LAELEVLKYQQVFHTGEKEYQYLLSV